MRDEARHPLEARGFRTTLLTDADRVTLTRAIGEFGRALREAGPEATGLFYYAGHGVQSFGTNYLLPVDARLSDAADLALARVMPAGHSLSVIEAAHRARLGALSSHPAVARARVLGAILAFDIETDEYAFDTVLEEPPKYSDALDKAVEIEGKITKFYNDVTRQSGTLMADVPRAFAAVAKKREGRRPTLELMAKAARPSQRGFKSPRSFCMP